MIQLELEQSGKIGQPDERASRANGVTRSLGSLLLFLGLTMVVAACGGSEVGTSSEEFGEVVDNTDSLPDADFVDAVVISDDVLVSPELTSPEELIINPDDDTELWVHFLGGDPDCTAAAATVLTETQDLVEIELQVGITQDALSRGCVAGDYELRVEVDLSESADGKILSAVGAPEADQANATATSFLGLTEDEAQALAEENELTWRTVRVDDEFGVVTEDYNPSRLNFEIDDGVVTAATLG